MEPGRQMFVTSELVSRDGARAMFKGKGEVDGNTTVAARFTLVGYNLRDRNSAWQERDDRIRAHLRELCEILRGELHPGMRDA
jgi:hypothetical protein